MCSAALVSLARSSGRLMFPPRILSGRVTACLHTYLYPYWPICQYLTIKSPLMSASRIQLSIHWLPRTWLLGSVAASALPGFLFFSPTISLQLVEETSFQTALPGLFASSSILKKQGDLNFARHPEKIAGCSWRCCCAGTRASALQPIHGSRARGSSENAKERFLCAHADTARKGKQKDLPREMVLLCTACFLYVFVFPPPRSGCLIGFWRFELVRFISGCVVAAGSYQVCRSEQNHSNKTFSPTFVCGTLSSCI